MCTSAPVYRCTVYLCTGEPVYQSTLVDVYYHTMYRCTSACIGVQVYRNTNLLVYPYNFVPISRCT